MMDKERIHVHSSLRTLVYDHKNRTGQRGKKYTRETRKGRKMMNP
jgi:hypothetical protein